MRSLTARTWIWTLVIALAVGAVRSPAAGQGRPNSDGKIGAGEYAKSLRHNPSGVTLHWTLSGDSIHIGLTATNDGWIGMGLLAQKTKEKQGADQYIFSIEDGKVVALDLYQANPTKRPAMDEEEGGKNSLVQPSVVRTKDDWVVEFSRRLNTGEKTDMEIVPGKKFDLMYAFGPEVDWKKEHRKTRRWTIEGFAFER